MTGPSWISSLWAVVGLFAVSLSGLPSMPTGKSKLQKHVQYHLARSARVERFQVIYHDLKWEACRPEQNKESATVLFSHQKDVAMARCHINSWLVTMAIATFATKQTLRMLVGFSKPQRKYQRKVSCGSHANQIPAKSQRSHFKPILIRPERTAS